MKEKPKKSKQWYLERVYAEIDGEIWVSKNYGASLGKEIWGAWHPASEDIDPILPGDIIQWDY